MAEKSWRNKIAVLCKNAKKLSRQLSTKKVGGIMAVFAEKINGGNFDYGIVGV